MADIKGQMHDLEGMLAAASLDEAFDASLDHEVQTDKDRVKLVPCRECTRPLVVTTFLASAKALCRGCKGETGDVASIGAPTPGSTNPASAVNLADCLINKGFATAICPVHPDNPEHVMELKAVAHSAHYGPGHYGPKGEWIQHAPGEVATHQCTVCLAKVDYSTTMRVEMRRQNESTDKPDLGPPERNYLYGVKDPVAA